MISWWWIGIVAVVVWCVARNADEIKMQPSPLDGTMPLNMNRVLGAGSVTFDNGMAKAQAGFKL